MGGGGLALRVAATWALARAGFSDTELGAGVQGRVLGVADMDGDGTLDVVTASADRFTVVYNTAEGFVATDSGADGSVAAVAALALADLDGGGAAASSSPRAHERQQRRGCLDVLNFNGGDPTSAGGEENLLSSYRRLGDDFVEGVVDNDAGGVVALVHADVNGDGAWTRSRLRALSAVAYLKNDGAGNEASFSRVLGTEDGMAPNAIFGNVDVDGDGNLDLLVTGDGGRVLFAQHAVKSTSYARGLVEQVTGTWGDICLDETSLLGGRRGPQLGDGSGGDNSASDALDTSAEYISRVRQAS
ncbi:hypothetical protein JL721_11557 [Aureococcus anophagefferens]|nr:hypothetical protein JL721_11557 [Aureococcus anophagefferens]